MLVAVRRQLLKNIIIFYWRSNGYISACQAAAPQMTKTKDRGGTISLTTAKPSTAATMDVFLSTAGVESTNLLLFQVPL